MSERLRLADLLGGLSIVSVRLPPAALQRRIRPGAVLFLYRDVLHIEIGPIEYVAGSAGPPRD
jgi:hypothetical protein